MQLYCSSIVQEKEQNQQKSLQLKNQSVLSSSACQFKKQLQCLRTCTFMYKLPSCTKTCHLPLPLLQFMMAPRNKISFNDIRPQCVFGNNCNNIIIDAQVNRQPAAAQDTAKTGSTTPLLDGLSLVCMV